MRSNRRRRTSTAWVPGADGQGCWHPASGPSPHGLDLDWVRGGGLVSDVPAGSGSVPQTTPAEGALTPMMQKLEAAFGPPGFDSAARATVFCELASEVGLDAVVGLLEALVEKRTSPDPGIERARPSVMRLLERGPAGVGSGAQILMRLFREHPKESILEAIGSHWRYGTGHDLGGDR